MSHPPMWDEADPLLQRVRSLALALPGAQEKISHGRPNWFTVKVFASWRAHLKGDHDAQALARSICVLPDADEREALLQDPRFALPAYLGPSGWVALNLAYDLGPDGPTTFRPDDVDHVDWDEVAELLETSFRNTAPKKLVALL